VAVSSFYSRIGGMHSNDRYVYPIIETTDSNFWLLLGAFWGYVCGCIGCDVLFHKLLKKEKLWSNFLKGIPFCILVSVIIGG